MTGGILHPNQDQVEIVTYNNDMSSRRRLLPPDQLTADSIELDDANYLFFTRIPRRPKRKFEKAALRRVHANRFEEEKRKLRQ